jgi:hypothetical protein
VALTLPGACQKPFVRSMLLVAAGWSGISCPWWRSTGDGDMVLPHAGSELHTKQCFKERWEPMLLLRCRHHALSTCTVPASACVEPALNLRYMSAVLPCGPRARPMFPERAFAVINLPSQTHRSQRCCGRWLICCSACMLTHCLCTCLFELCQTPPRYTTKVLECGPAAFI